MYYIAGMVVILRINIYLYNTECTVVYYHSIYIDYNVCCIFCKLTVYKIIQKTHEGALQHREETFSDSYISGFDSTLLLLIGTRTTYAYQVDDTLKYVVYLTISMIVLRSFRFIHKIHERITRKLYHFK